MAPVLVSDPPVCFRTIWDAVANTDPDTCGLGRAWALILFNPTKLSLGSCQLAWPTWMTAGGTGLSPEVGDAQDPPHGPNSPLSLHTPQKREAWNWPPPGPSGEQAEQGLELSLLGNRPACHLHPTQGWEGSSSHRDYWALNHSKPAPRDCAAGGADSCPFNTWPLSAGIPAGKGPHRPLTSSSSGQATLSTKEVASLQCFCSQPSLTPISFHRLPAQAPLGSPGVLLAGGTYFHRPGANHNAPGVVDSPASLEPGPTPNARSGGQAHPVPAAHCPVWLVFLALTSPSILAHWDHSGHCHLHSVLEGPRSGLPGIHRHTTATASHPPRVGNLQHLLSLTWATVGAGRNHPPAGGFREWLTDGS